MVTTGSPRGEVLGQVIYLVQGFRNWIHFLTCYQERGRKEKANFSFPFPSQISKYHHKTRQDRVDTATDSIKFPSPGSGEQPMNRLFLPEYLIILSKLNFSLTMLKGCTLVIITGFYLISFYKEVGTWYLKVVC